MADGLVAGKVALVTGGGSGIGRATCLALAREGAHVVVADLKMESAAETVALINRAGGQAAACASDVTVEADVARIVETARATFGRLDCAFNNAGIATAHVGQSGRKLAEWDAAAFERVIAVNLTAVWRCMRHEIPLMRANGGGVIVNTASIAGLVGLHLASAYVAAKHGVIGLTKSGALDHASDGIRVNAVCPGYIETPMTTDIMQRAPERVLRNTPMGRLGQPAEIAELVVWLCSDRASYVTGASYNADGGYVAM